MDPKKLFVDERLKGICAYCGAIANTRDHVPSKILLDKPYPEDIPVAESCQKCNQGFSVSEEYVACLIDCVINGTTIPNQNFRKKISRTLCARPTIAQRIERGRTVSSDNQLVWRPEAGPVKDVILKLARGHVAYELGLQHPEEPECFEIVPIINMTDLELDVFISFHGGHLYPEIGSRAFINVFNGQPTAFEQWNVIQSDRYQYAVGQSDGDWVRIILSNYLTCYVAWK